MRGKKKKEREVNFSELRREVGFRTLSAEAKKQTKLKERTERDDLMVGET